MKNYEFKICGKDYTTGFRAVIKSNSSNSFKWVFFCYWYLTQQYASLRTEQQNTILVNCFFAVNSLQADMLRVVSCAGNLGIGINDICCGSSAVKSICRSLLDVCSVCVTAIPCHWGCLVLQFLLFPSFVFQKCQWDSLWQSIKFTLKSVALS